MKIILGSSSIHRKKILEKMGFCFSVVSPDFDESSIKIDDPVLLTMALANAKADCVLRKIGEEAAIVIASDQVVVCGGQIFGKPESEEEARSFLRRYRDEPSQTITSVVVATSMWNKRFSGTDIAKIWLKPIPEDAIAKLIQGGEIFSCAGALNVEVSKEYIERIEGEMESIIGLPKKLTLELLSFVNEN